ncbi:GerAB/ArcD/ProY family transporter [Paenibacillus arenilitoris]|uniref:Endospore germination permease n=1 Tax=Paenibacillus arenilitoris TaxID=2772299 RepID=A0A927H605_9BACL|nr:endospore germination permease [Paenibacillus arenilitoris]MBD2869088.1 endospore germination permease [Paenibacillus arenilitoris]
MRLTISQFFWTIATMEITMNIWLTISPTITLVGQDAWIAMLIGGMIGTGVTYAASRIGAHHPGKSLIGLSEDLFGEWLGKAVSLYYLLGWYSVTIIILRAMAEFIQLILFSRTSAVVLSAIMVVTMIYITHRGGITAIGRFSQIVGPLFFLVILITFILNSPNINLQHLLPVYADHGFAAIMGAAVPHASFLSESILIMILIPFLQSRKATRPAIIAVIVSSLFVTVATALVIMTFGPHFSGKFINPYFNMVRFISVLEFIQNMDVWVIFVWLLCVFVKLSLYLFITSHATAELLRIKEWRKVVWYLGGIYLLVSALPPNIVTVITDYYEKMWIPLIFWPNMIVLPSIMLAISLAKKRAGG